MKKIINKYITFIKYGISAGISFSIDYGLFSLFSYILKIYIDSKGIIVATILARIISSFINYHINRNNVFNTRDGKKIDKETLIKYTSLVIIQMFVSSFTVYGIYNATKIDEKIIKIPVECVLFLVNYFVQKKYIFINNK